MKKILLVNTPFYRLLGSHYNGISLGISYIASFLNANNHDAWVYNSDFLKNNIYENTFKIYENFESYTEIFANIKHPIWKTTVDSIIKFNPDFVGYTSYTANLPSIDIISKLVRETNPLIRQIIGGPHATLDFNILEKLEAVDIAIKREGEVSSLKILNEIPLEEISGISFKRNGRIITTNPPEIITNIDELPFPERKKIWSHNGPATNEELENMDFSYIATMRGCPYRCSFCASPKIWGRDKLQYRSPENIKSEIVQIKTNHWNRKPIDYAVLSANTNTKANLLKDNFFIDDNAIIYFVDDVFTIKKTRAIEIMQKVAECEVPWKCEARADLITEEIAAAMKNSNCKRVKLGIESGSDRILKLIKKDETKEKMLKGIRILQKYDIPITAYLMAGFPTETDEDLEETIEFAKMINANYYSISIVSPYFGTQIYIDSISQGEKLDRQPWEYFFHQSKKMMLNQSISEKKLFELWKLTETNNYL